MRPDPEEDSGSSSGDPIATLYARVLPNPYPVRLDGKQQQKQQDGHQHQQQQQQQQQQLAPLNPLYVRRFAAEIARSEAAETG
jgi:hypothetical protein